MRTRRLIVLATLAAACTHAPPRTDSQAGGAADVASSDAARRPGEPRWVAELRPTFQRSAEVKPQGETRAYGVVNMTRGSTNESTHLTITYSTPVTNAAFAWSLHSGRCGSGEMSVVAPGSFPQIEVGSSGRGSASVDIYFPFPMQGSYHVNVFRDNGSRLEDVVSCGNLTFHG